MSSFYKTTGRSIFWIWNCLFGLAAVYSMFALASAFTDFINGREYPPFSFFVCLFFISVVPFVSVFVTAYVLENDPRKLMKYFYGFEVPLILVCWVRLAYLGELTSGALFLGTAISLGGLAYLYFLWHEEKKESGRGYFDVVLASCLAVIAFYVAAVLLMMTFPSIWLMIKEIVTFKWLGSVQFANPFVSYPAFRELIAGFVIFLLFVLIFSLFSSLFFALPFVFVWLYFSAWFRVSSRGMWQQAVVFLIGAGVLLSGLFYVSNVQPQIAAFKLLRQPAETSQEKQRVLAETDTVRAGLVNAYLYAYRYLGAYEHVNSVGERFRKAFDLSPENAAGIQGVFNQLIAPILYKGRKSDDAEATKLYAAFFDAPIQEAEAEAITSAVRSYQRRSNNAGLLDANLRKVWLAEQNVTTKREGAVTKVELHEVYQNKTADVQEIYYNFSLPENAAITGIWLGGSRNKDERFKYVVSPRGAAQRVYNAQVRRRVDPALLEQVGPRQYRLRIFPIEPAGINRRAGARIEPPELHFWMTYVVLTEGKLNVFPQLQSKRNVFWDTRTERTLNGKNVVVAYNWMPATSDGPQATWENRSTYFQHDSKVFKVGVSRVTETAQKKAGKIGVVLDSSYSMRGRRDDVANAIKWLQAYSESVDVYVQPVNETMRKLKGNEYDLSDLVFYGSVAYQSLWGQADTVQEIESYDAVLVITDAGNYELEDKKAELPDTKTPIYLVHMHRHSPQYTDALNERLSKPSNGAAHSVQDAVRMLLLRKELKDNQRAVGAYVWTFEEVTEGSDVKGRSGFDHVAARVYVDYLAAREEKLELETLDAIHNIAKAYSVVTSYSSMIVLVNNAQREQLRGEEKSKNRFQRSHESGAKVLSKPSSPLVIGTPEPEEWLLLILSLMLLSYFYFRRKGMFGL